MVKKRRRRKLRKKTKGERGTCLSQLMKMGLQGQGRGLCAAKHEEGSDTKSENCADKNEKWADKSENFAHPP